MKSTTLIIAASSLLLQAVTGLNVVETREPQVVSYGLERRDASPVGVALANPLVCLSRNMKVII